MEHDPTGRRRRRLDQWCEQWPATAAAAGADRDAMVDRYAEIHAQTCAERRRADRCDQGHAAHRSDRTRLEALVAEHEELGRTVSPDAGGRGEIVGAAVRRLLPAVTDMSTRPAVVPAGGAAPLRVERSRPGWQLSGTATRVPWHDGSRRAIVFAVDEGDNEVVTVVDVAALEIAPDLWGGRRLATVACRELALTDGDVVHAPGVRDRLADRLTVLSLAEALGAARWLLERRALGESSIATRLDIGRAAVEHAARSALGAPLVVSHHDTSAAAVYALGMCEQMVSAATSAAVDPETQLRVDRIRQCYGTDDVTWHRRRLVPLI